MIRLLSLFLFLAFNAAAFDTTLKPATQAQVNAGRLNSVAVTPGTLAGFLPTASVLRAVTADGVYEPEAASYFTTNNITDSDARERINGFFRELRLANILTNLVDGIFGASDLNPSLRTMRGAYATNTLGASQTIDGLNLFWLTNRCIFPLSGMTSFSNSVLLDQILYTNNTGLNFSPFCLSASNTDYLLNYSSKLQWRSNAVFAELGAVTEPYNGVVNWANDWERVQVATYDNRVTWNLWLNGLIAPAAASNALAAIPNAPVMLVLGQRRNTTSTFDLGAHMTARVAAVFNRPLTSNEIWSCQLACRWLNPARETWVFLGDSTTAPNDAPWVLAEYPNILAKNGTRFHQAAFVNTAHSGYTAAQLVTDSYFRLAKWKPYGRSEKVRVFLGAGINDIGTGSTAATTFASLTNLFLIGRTNNMELDVFTLSLINTNQASGWTAAKEVSRLSYNDMIITNRPLYDRLWRKDVLVGYSDMDSNNVPQLTFDGLHFTAVGNQLIVNMLAGDTPTAAAFRGTQLIVTGTTNQLIFGGTNTAPDSGTSILWVSVQIVGDTNVYKLGIAK